MKAHKRYLTLIATLALTASLPLGAMKRKNNQEPSSEETEEKKYKITPKQEKISGFLGEKFYEAMELIKKVGIILNTTYEKEKSTPINKLSENSLRQILKKHGMPEDIFLQEIKTSFSPEAIQLFTSWCETTQNSEENDKLFENIINYELEHEKDGSFLIYNEIKNIYDKEKIDYPTIEEFNTTCIEQDPQKRLIAWNKYKEKKTFHSDTISISNFSKFQECITTTAQEIGVEIKSIEINNCTTTGVDFNLKKLYFDINELLYYHCTDDEIKGILQHEYDHLKKNNPVTITNIISSFLNSISKKSFLPVINDKNIIKLIRKNTAFISQFCIKTNELFADQEAYNKNNMIHFIRYFAKIFIEIKKVSKEEDPIACFDYLLLDVSDHIPTKQRIIFWAKKLLMQSMYCPWIKPTQQDKKYIITTCFPSQQEHINFIINTPHIINTIYYFKGNTCEKNLENCYPIRLKIFTSSFIYAVKNGILCVVQKLLKKENKNILKKTDEKKLRTAFLDATEYGYVDIIREFFTLENRDILNKMDKKTLELSFQHAAENGHLNIIQEFFTRENKDIFNKIEKDSLQRALKKAVKNGHDSTVKEMLNNKIFMSHISKQNLIDIYNKATNDQDMLNILKNAINLFK